MDRKTYTLFPVHIDENIADENADKLHVWVVATHSDIVINNRVYPRAMLEKSVKSWLRPYKKPVLVNHNRDSDPIGRVVHAEFIGEEIWDQRIVELTGKYVPLADGATGAIVLCLEIVDGDAVEKVLDGRYHTVSIGGQIDHAYCSICGTDWIDDDFCDHHPGKIYDGKPMYLITEGLKYTEISFVSVPADEYAYVVKVGDESAVTIITDTQNNRVFVTLGKKEVRKMATKKKTAADTAKQDAEPVVDIQKIEAAFEHVNGILNQLVEKVGTIESAVTELKTVVDNLSVPPAEDQTEAPEEEEKSAEKTEARDEQDSSAQFAEAVRVLVDKLNNLIEVLQSRVNSESEEEAATDKAEENEEPEAKEETEEKVDDASETSEKPKVKTVKNPVATPMQDSEPKDAYEFIRRLLQE